MVFISLCYFYVEDDVINIARFLNVILDSFLLQSRNQCMWVEEGTQPVSWNLIFTLEIQVFSEWIVSWH